MSFDFTGKAVFVMGGTSGINLGIAQGFAKAGARVAVASRSQDKVDAAVATLGQGAFGFSVDVRDAEAVAAIFKEAQARFGQPIDVLVSGAAGNFPAPAKDLSANGFKAVADIDLQGTFNVMKGAYPHLARPGAIINISAPQAYVPMALQVHVCAAKAGVDMITRTLAMEWGPEGIRVNSLVPGPIAGTEGMARLAPTPELTAMVEDSVPLKRNGSPADLANAALFLASPLASYISGVILPVDGGWSLAGVSSAMDGIARMMTKAGRG
ncbi:SDR family oxidoreductase [Gallaecimonas xiamenensis]|uniref:Short chain dehydrogenase n=1 Tax=Gallaecimonas xiamenensis 3-C-1 TaxID=745411 RepID=K2JGW2_9GAMM|nr:SDR family oxidoreductase [Gallaecimonas xiamenensis]EKE69894.1 short chain dehydrogenase [Gallaecimonas xiamenensis 3-C-1]